MHIKAATASASAVVTTANMVDVVSSKKRQHDAIEQDFVPMVLLFLSFFHFY